MKKEAILIVLSIILISCVQDKDYLAQFDCSDSFGEYSMDQSIELYSNSDKEIRDLYVFNLEKGLEPEKTRIENKIALIKEDVYSQITSEEDIGNIRGFWSYDDLRSGSSKKGRLLRIEQEDIPYWESIVSDLSSTQDQIIFAKSILEVLKREYEYGRKYALIEADYDEMFLENKSIETKEQLTERKIKAREKEAEVICEKIKLQKLFLTQHIR